MSNWDFKVSFFDGPMLVYETVHKGHASMQIEIDIHAGQMAHKKGDRIVVADMRPKWARDLHGQAWWARDLTRVIRRGDLQLDGKVVWP